MTDGSGFPPSSHADEPPPPLGPESAALLTPVGISLVVYNGLSVLSGLVNILMWGFVKELVAKEAARDKQMKPMLDLLEMPWMGAMNWIGLVLAIVALVGSIYLLRGRGYGLAMTGAIVTMLNPGGACCCLVGTALGVWALVVLLKPEAQAVFNRP